MNGAERGRLCHAAAAAAAAAVPAPALSYEYPQREEPSSATSAPQRRSKTDV